MIRCIARKIFHFEYYYYVLYGRNSASTIANIILGDELSIHDHELVLLKDNVGYNDDDHDYHQQHDHNNLSPISRSLSESDLSELCLTTTGDAAVRAIHSGSPHAHHGGGSLPPSDDETHHLLQYDDDELLQLQQHHNINNNRRALLTSDMVVPVSMEGSVHNHNGHLQSNGDRYDEHNYSALSTRSSLPPPPILPPKKGTVGNREQNVHAPPRATYHKKIHDTAELPYHNVSDRYNEHLNQHAKNARLNKMTSQQQVSNEIKNNLNNTAAKKQQQLHEQQRHSSSNYHHQHFEQFNTYGSNSGSSSSSERRNYNNNKAYQNNNLNEGKIG